ncbi:hypothetical protein I547_0511 [Mycobacterium kansasii 824]|uniref:Uncharacterized protein n=1 Tax=Mycobacterium kansasii TaxID=1768 RepID=A0A1V3XZY1_MYCKA|nr:hypothetical protein I547_0511 [Mycobacterium kansasii 824]OOK82203.1 hypothetical protein BZL30_0950 [Mycobacterium kansasii]OOK84632.1 hypothetical protein BZL29_0951 [Mycobacterium kansasii]
MTDRRKWGWAREVFVTQTVSRQVHHRATVRWCRADNSSAVHGRHMCG